MSDSFWWIYTPNKKRKGQPLIMTLSTSMKLPQEITNRLLPETLNPTLLDEYEETDDEEGMP